jgi:hypothetical protein
MQVVQEQKPVAQLSKSKKIDHGKITNFGNALD